MDNRTVFLFFLIAGVLSGCASSTEYVIERITTHPYPSTVYEAPPGKTKVLIFNIYPNPSTLGDKPAIFDWCSLRGRVNEVRITTANTSNSEVVLHNAHWIGGRRVASMGGEHRCRVEIGGGWYNLCLSIILRGFEMTAGGRYAFVEDIAYFKPGHLYLPKYKVNQNPQKSGIPLFKPGVGIWIEEDETSEIVFGDPEGFYQEKNYRRYCSAWGQ